MAKNGKKWPKIAILGHFWPKNGHFWPFLAIFGQFWPILRSQKWRFWPVGGLLCSLKMAKNGHFLTFFLAIFRPKTGQNWPDFGHFGGSKFEPFLSPPGDAQARPGVPGQARDLEPQVTRGQRVQAALRSDPGRVQSGH